MPTSTNIGTYRVTDADSDPIEVGTRVTYYERPVLAHGTVTEVTEADVDYDDALGRARIFPPVVTVRYDDGEIARYETSNWTEDEPWFVCEEIEVIVK